jgi:hypothetical protein
MFAHVSSSVCAGNQVEETQLRLLSTSSAPNSKQKQGQSGSLQARAGGSRLHEDQKDAWGRLELRRVVWRLGVLEQLQDWRLQAGAETEVEEGAVPAIIAQSARLLETEAGQLAYETLRGFEEAMRGLTVTEMRLQQQVQELSDDKPTNTAAAALQGRLTAIDERRSVWLFVFQCLPHSNQLLDLVLPFL